MIRRLREGGPWQLICLPFAGGTADMYRPLAAAMSPEWEVAAIEAPGRGGVPGPPLSDFDKLAAAQERAVVAAARRPYVLFGHSLGGALAFRIAQRLAGSARSPAAIALSGCRPPGSPDLPVPRSTASDGELIDFLRRVGGTDDRLLADPEFLSYALPLLRSDLRAGETLVFQDHSALALPAVLLAGTSDDVVPPAVMEGWRIYLPLASVHEIRGGHMFVVTAPTATAAPLRALARDAAREGPTLMESEEAP
jgi:surfactin synthase thioesterase subunit